MRAHALDLTHAHALDLTHYGFSHISNFLAQKSLNHSLLHFSDKSQTLRFSDLAQTYWSNNRLPKNICPKMTKKKTPSKLLMVALPVIPRNAMGQTDVRGGGIITRWTKNLKWGPLLKVKAPISNTKKKKKTADKSKAPVAFSTDKHVVTAPPFKVKAVVLSTFSCSIKINSLPLCKSGCCNALSWRCLRQLH